MIALNAEIEAYARRYAEIAYVPPLSEAVDLVRGIFREQNMAHIHVPDNVYAVYAKKFIRMVNEFQSTRPRAESSDS